MKDINLLEKLKERPIFSIKDIQRIGGFSAEYSKLVANRLSKRKLIKKITKNAYTLKDDIFVVASNIKIPCYISFWSASSFYGFTEQILNTIYVATTRKIKSIKFLEYKIKFVELKDFFGYNKIKTNNGEIFIVEIEKLAIDCFLNYKSMGNFDEIIKIFENSEGLSKEKIIEYLKRINNLSLSKKVGFMLEKYRKIDISKEFEFDRNYVLLNPFSKKYESLNSKWRLKV